MLISRKKYLKDIEIAQRKGDYAGFTRGYDKGLQGGINRGILTERITQTRREMVPQYVFDAGLEERW